MQFKPIILNSMSKPDSKFQKHYRFSKGCNKTSNSRFANLLHVSLNNNLVHAL